MPWRQLATNVLLPWLGKSILAPDRLALRRCPIARPVGFNVLLRSHILIYVARFNAASSSWAFPVQFFNSGMAADVEKAGRLALQSGTRENQQKLPSSPTCA